ncbi:Hsp20/alpha crystallin family protein [Flaviflexus equikiangi]|uniref:Hsp20/alpha crystallin family protein n=1 Tax=Flaviflexus equikiangi TaxID=2758573 RepID=A0ABS2TJG5_9ACTO|nr:Hsp20/alpha crystallin family protein [Flaviflexus equikiangi]MBM9433424.1 Hsp20/alpha crystallin family protein [Flaviflexus equikiangi]
MAKMNDPFQDLERLFSSSFTRPTVPGMPMDLVRTGDEYVAELDLPGVDPATIDIDIDDRTLTVRAERKGREGEVEWLTKERPTGTFARQLTLGYGVAVDKIKADYSGGVLTLTFPVAEEAKPRKISVNTPDDRKTIDA